MKNYEYVDNAYWESDDRSVLKCIKLSKQEGKPDNQKKKEILQFHRLLPDGAECPNYKEVVSLFGIARIDEHTKERKTRKDREGKEKRAIHDQRKKSAELEELYKLKLQAFEIEEIKNSEDRTLRSKLRRSKSVAEMNAVTSILIAKELGLFGAAE